MSVDAEKVKKKKAKAAVDGVDGGKKKGKAKAKAKADVDAGPVATLPVLDMNNYAKAQAERDLYHRPALAIHEYLVEIEELMKTLSGKEADVKKFTEHAKWAAAGQIALGATALTLGIALCFVTAGAAVPVLIAASQVAGWTAAASSAYGDVNRGRRKKMEGGSNQNDIEEKVEEIEEEIKLNTGFGMITGKVQIISTKVFAHGFDSDSGGKAGVAAGSKMGMGFGGNRSVLAIVETAGTGTATLAQVGFGMSAAGGAVSVCLGARNLLKEGTYDSTIVYMACQKELKQHLKTLELFVAQLKDKIIADFLDVFELHFPMQAIVARIANLSKTMAELDIKISKLDEKKVVKLLEKAEKKAMGTKEKAEEAREKWRKAYRKQYIAMQELLSARAEIKKLYEEAVGKGEKAEKKIVRAIKKAVEKENAAREKESEAANAMDAAQTLAEKAEAQYMMATAELEVSIDDVVVSVIGFSSRERSNAASSIEF
jgi:hypothetical protein